MQTILYENEVVPQELKNFLEVKHFHTPNKTCDFRYVLHLHTNVLTLCVAADVHQRSVEFFLLVYISLCFTDSSD